MKKDVSFYGILNVKMSSMTSSSIYQSLVLIAAVTSKPLLLYVRAMDYNLGASLTKINERRHEQAIYYLCWTMI